MARIAIIGPGAIGGVLAAWLGRAGRHEVVLCARRPLGPFTVETPAGTIPVELQVLTDPAQARPADWVLVTTKSYDAAGAAAWFPGLGAQGATVAVLQNGVEHRERFAPWLPAERLLPVVVDFPAGRVGPALIRQRGRGLLTVSDDAPGRGLADLFARTEIDVVLTSDFTSAAWRKLCLNAVGALSALLLQPAGVMRDEALGEVALELARECIAVGRAEGAILEDALADNVLQGYRRAPPDAVNSLHADRLAGRPMEIDARNGVIVRLGRKHGIATPCNRMVVALLEIMSRAKPPPAPPQA